MQLFCFTIAGGTAAFFNQLEETCGSQMEVIKLEYPGHGLRHKEKLCDTFRELSRDLYGQIKEKYAGGGYALMGYSMGSVAALETLRYLLARRELPEPEYIFLAAHEPRAVVRVDKFSSGELDEYVKDRTILFGGVPERLVHNKTFWRMYLPLYRADYLMISRYDFESLKFTTDIPVMVFYSEKDTPRTSMEHWRKYFTGHSEFVEYPGTHFFIQEHYREMAALIMERLQV